ncbi:MAG: hypothetical protein IJS81_06525 [Selenomonadaceae bacterium]|nr:hypothetical protein [Selenomonadaceae bacterium]
MFIDLHIHSTASDGTDTPEIIAQKISSHDGIKIFSLTDHDNINGVKKIKSSIPPEVFFINGIEFSCKTPNFKCHILAYFYDENNAELQAVIEHGRKILREKVNLRLKYLGELYGINFSADDLAALNRHETVSKPHIVNFLAESYGKNRRQVYADLKKFKVGNMRLNISEVISAVKSAGGLTVWAHPLGGEGEKILSPQEFSTRLEELISCGINGLECYYSRYNLEQEKFLAETARQKNLLISGGSDYHGKNKSDIELGQLGNFDVDIKIYQLTILQEIFARHENLRVRKAFEIAKTAHKGQVDKSGVDYIFHPLTVAFQCGGNISALIIALLHDVVEDSDLTFEELQKKIPLTDEELQALKLLTHDEKNPYLEYVEKIKSNELAAQVKIADLKHNSDLSRIDKNFLTEKDFKRVEKYKAALKILSF